MNGVFEGSALEDVKLPSTLRKIEYRAFTDCRNLKRVALPEALERIESECFSGSGLESVRFPPALRAIGESAFRKCGELKEVAFSNGLESIGLFAFCRTGIESVEFPPSLRTVAQGAFCMCKGLRTAKLNEGLEALGTDEYQEEGKMWCGVFEESALEEVALPSTLRKIEYRAFENCKNLRRVLLPDGLERVGRACFLGSGLEGI